MTAAPSDAARAANLGAPLRLTDGRTVTLQYTLRGLAMLEDKFGSLKGIEGVLGGGDKPVIRPLCALLAAGLSHENISADDLLDLLDLEAMQEYVGSASAALNVALPAVDPQQPRPKKRAARGGVTSSIAPSAVEYNRRSSGR